MREATKPRIVDALESACAWIDERRWMAATLRIILRRHCALADLSMWLDERWQTGRWANIDA